MSASGYMVAPVTASFGHSPVSVFGSVTGSAISFLGGFSKPSEIGVGIRSSVADAKKIVEELAALLAPEAPAKVKIPALFRCLNRFLPCITERRVRALLHAEARIVDHCEMLCLKEALSFEKSRHARRELQRTATRLAVFLASQGAPLDRAQADALGRLAGEVDCTGGVL